MEEFGDVAENCESLKKSKKWGKTSIMGIKSGSVEVIKCFKRGICFGWCITRIFSFFSSLSLPNREKQPQKKVNIFIDIKNDKINKK